MVLRVVAIGLSQIFSFFSCWQTDERRDGRRKIVRLRLLSRYTKTSRSNSVYMQNIILHLKYSIFRSKFYLLFSFSFTKIMWPYQLNDDEMISGNILVSASNRHHGRQTLSTALNVAFLKDWSTPKMDEYFLFS